MKKKDFNLSSKQMLLDIGSMTHQAKKLLAKEHEYNTLLKAILKIEYYYDESAHLPTLKEISATTGIKYDKVRQQIRKIYDDLIFGGRDENIPGPCFTFNEITYSFSVKGFNKNRIYFEMGQLPVVPRVGEEIHLPFFSAYLNTTRFHVESVTHWFNNQQQEVYINLLPGEYNCYWQYRKDKAMEEGEIGLMRFYDMEEWELKKELGIGRWK